MCLCNVYTILMTASTIYKGISLKLLAICGWPFIQEVRKVIQLIVNLRLRLHYITSDKVTCYNTKSS